jgi:hypothetical protein
MSFCANRKGSKRISQTLRIVTRRKSTRYKPALSVPPSEELDVPVAIRVSNLSENLQAQEFKTLLEPNYIWAENKKANFADVVFDNKNAADDGYGYCHLILKAEIWKMLILIEN